MTKQKNECATVDVPSAMMSFQILGGCACYTAHQFLAKSPLMLDTWLALCAIGFLYVLPLLGQLSTKLETVQTLHADNTEFARKSTFSTIRT